MIVWAAYDRRTGRVIEELPGLKITSSLSQIIGRGDPVTAQLPVSDRLTDQWGVATQPMRAVIAGVISGGGLPSEDVVVWAGWVESRSYGSGPYITLKLQSPEEWLARNYVSAATYRNQPYTQIMRSLGLDAVAAQFHGVVEEVVSPYSGDRTYTADQDLTRLKAMQNLMRTQNGPEFALSWRMDDDSALCLVARTAPRVGRASSKSSPLSLLFSDIEWQYSEDCGDGRGATIFTGVATRTGDQRVTVTQRSNPLIDQGFLELERRWQPDTGSVSLAIIGDYVTAARLAQENGTSTYDVSIQLHRCVPNRDFQLGDDVAVDLANPDLPGVARSITMRLLGWVADPDPISGEIVTIKPILYDEGD